MRSFETSSDIIFPDKLPTEVVERKGIGHPDTLADGIAESTEIAYANYCLENFDLILHHNLDKAMLLGGLCLQKFGGEEFTKPIKMLFMGRASRSFGSHEIPLEDIQRTSAQDYLSRVMPHLDTNNSSMYETITLTTTNSTRPYWFNPRNINDMPEYIDSFPKANDTATMISYWPMTNTEKLVLDLEGYFYENNDVGLPVPRFDYIGQDIKVMAVRNNNLINVTISIPQITTNTQNEKIYFERENYIQNLLQDYAEILVDDQLDVRVNVNPQTKNNNPRPYLVTSGSCIDFGEEGAVGRGNKTHGIISSFRPNTMEAPHGKNPTYFVGKILGYQADLISKQIYDRLGTRCQVVMQANLGDNLFDPSKIIVSTEHKIDKSVIENVVLNCLELGRLTTSLIIEEEYFLPRTNAWK